MHRYDCMQMRRRSQCTPYTASVERDSQSTQTAVALTQTSAGVCQPCVLTLVRCAPTHTDTISAALRRDVLRATSPAETAERVWVSAAVASRYDSSVSSSPVCPSFHLPELLLVSVLSVSGGLSPCR
ncbi:uncharacterized protein [Sinocyclocheilus grahami]|uniref:uncharacterized protein isoform X1 n=1 Tax=Sinocyclocheilus grahami TaxID=75366 RepID=UPI0007AD4F63|nr:PREDICTED: uncharacterized protein LOC107598486 isoform X1 [Sinocyclocheilus grahami]